MARLEPCEGKLSRTVLRGGRGGNASPLPDYKDRAFIAGRPQFKEQYDLVQFEQLGCTFRRPRWRRISKEEAEALCGCRL